MTSQKPILSFVRGTLDLRGIPTNADPGLASAGWCWDSRVGVWRCDAYRYSDVVRALRSRQVDFEDRVPAWHEVRWPQRRLVNLRSEQRAACESWMTIRSGCLVLPTGVGKTDIALAIMGETKITTLVVVPIRDLMYQWHRRIQESLGYDAGLIGDRHFSVGPVSVTTYDSAMIHMERLGPRYGLVVFDECHHLPGHIRQDAARMCAAPWRLGLTATPERADGRHTLLDDLIGPIRYRLPITMVKGTTLADYAIERITVHLSAEEQRRYDRLSSRIRSYLAFRRRVDPAYDWRKLCAESSSSNAAMQILRAFQSRKAIEYRATEKLRVLEDLFRLHLGERMLIFAGSNSMVRDVALRFLIPCLLSETSHTERAAILQGLANGEYPAVVANRVLDEGVDVPEVKVAVVIGGLGSQRQAQQRLGRILRRSGNVPARLYEVVCAETRELQRFQQHRKCDAYQATRNRSV